MRGRGFLLISSILMISAVLLSLAIGVLIAHAVCVSMFTLFRIHSRQLAARTPRTAAPLGTLAS